MKPRKSTAILLTAWLATFLVYLVVRPDMQQPATLVVPAGSGPVAVSSH